MNRGELNLKIKNLGKDMIKSGISQIYNESIFFKGKNTISVIIKCPIPNMTKIINIIDRYKKFIENRFYNFILFDGALIQIFYRFEMDKIVEHRLAYVPCPITLTCKEIYDDSIIEMIDIIKENNVELNKRLNDRKLQNLEYRKLSKIM
jgi:hypothetical protein